MGDEELVRLYREGNDQCAFIELELRYSSRFVTYLEQHHHRTFLRFEEMYWACFDAKLRNAIETFDSERGHDFRSFLMTCLAHGAEDVRRQIKRRPTEVLPDDIKDKGAKSPLDVLENEEMKKLVRQAIQREPPDCQALLALRYDSEIKSPFYRNAMPILSVMSYVKTESGWRGTMKKNKKDITDYLDQHGYGPQTE